MLHIISIYVTFILHFDHNNVGSICWLNSPFICYVRMPKNNDISGILHNSTITGGISGGKMDLPIPSPSRACVKVWLVRLYYRSYVSYAERWVFPDLPVCV